MYTVYGRDKNDFHAAHVLHGRDKNDFHAAHVLYMSSMKIIFIASVNIKVLGKILHL